MAEIMTRDGTADATRQGGWKAEELRTTAATMKKSSRLQIIWLVILCQYNRRYQVRCSNNISWWQRRSRHRRCNRLGGGRQKRMRIQGGTTIRTLYTQAETAITAPSYPMDKVSTTRGGGGGGGGGGRQTKYGGAINNRIFQWDTDKHGELREVITDSGLQL